VHLKVKSFPFKNAVCALPLCVQAVCQFSAPSTAAAAPLVERPIVIAHRGAS
jgi:hypothetical protein